MKSRLIKDKQAKDEIKAQVVKMKDLLKHLMSSTPKYPAPSEILILMSRKEVDGLTEMKKKATWVENWLNTFKFDTDKFLEEGFKYYYRGLKLVKTLEEVMKKWCEEEENLRVFGKAEVH